MLAKTTVITLRTVVKAGSSGMTYATNGDSVLDVCTLHPVWGHRMSAYRS